MKRGRKAKDKFEDLDSDFKDGTAAMDSSDLRQKISEIALNSLAFEKAKKEDQDLAQKKEQAKFAAAPYNEAKKANSLKILWIRNILDGRGENVGEK
jgi:hypothetical protein